jgi:topoisomerase-4 subunit B
MSVNEDKIAYDESSFRILDGLEPVRNLPGMYTRTENPLHIIQEVIDNAADEALGGYATEIHVTMEADGSVKVSDNGRGIPVGLHPEEKIPVVVLAFNRLHAGGKFDKKNGGAYAFSGGLHGVGVAVTTALSLSILVEVHRNGKIYEVSFFDGGRIIGDVIEKGVCEKDVTGTSVTALPDPQYFDSPKIPMAELERLLRSKAVLLPGVKVTLTVDGHPRTWVYKGGMTEYFNEMLDGAESPVPVFSAENFVGPETNVDVVASSVESPYSEGEGCEFVFAWYPDGGGKSESYVNLIPTSHGGTHDSGLKAGIFDAVKAFVDHHNLLPKNVKLQQEDVTSKLAYVLSAKVLAPQFQGQVKDKLSSRQAHRLISTMVRGPFESWLNSNVEYGKAISEIAIKQALSRQKTAQIIDKKKSSGVMVLPGKLVDCEFTSDNELFLVEGDSAGGSAKMARNRDNQAILPLRGKVLNTLEIDAGRLFGNTEVHDISVAVGVDPHKINSDPAKVLENARYNKIVIMTDADVDGAHIQTLLLTLFHTHFPHLLTQNRIFVAMSPLYRIVVASHGKAQPRRFYALDDHEKASIIQKLTREGVKDEKIEIGRFKGLGEMNPEQLKYTSMDPATRRVLPVVYDLAFAEEINRVFNLCMSKDEAAGRREWLSEYGHTVMADI